VHVERCNFGEAVNWLKDRFGAAEALSTVAKQTERMIEEKPRHPFQPSNHMKKTGSKFATISREFVRKLPSAIVDALHDSGAVYADDHQNAVFLRRSIQGEVTGAPLRGTVGQSNAFKGLAAGSRRMEGWFMLKSGQSSEVQRAIVCKSAVAALSYVVLHATKQKTLYVSTDGATIAPVEQLCQIPQVILAFDRDELGEAMVQRIGQALPNCDRHSPSAKDWNEDLQQHLSQVQQ